MPDQYEITKQTIDLQDSTDEAQLLTIKHGEGEITLCFMFGKLYSGESIFNGEKIKIK